MSKKVKAGRFKYDLQTVLKVREIKEKKEEEKFAEKQRTYLTEKEKEELLEAERQNKRNELRGIMKKGPISDFAKILRRKAHLGKLKEDIDAQVEKVIEASQRLEEQRAKLIDAMKDKKLMQSLEIKFLDEIATERFRHEKAGG